MKIWVIQNKERKQIEVETGDIYKDGYKWKLVTNKEIETFDRKLDAEQWKKVFGVRGH